MPPEQLEVSNSNGSWNIAKIPKYFLKVYNTEKISKNAKAVKVDENGESFWNNLPWNFRRIYH